MSQDKTTRTSRRRFLKSLLLALPAIAIFKYIRPTQNDEIVEVKGWILKRSDLA
jgi:hypothetical protein